MDLNKKTALITGGSKGIGKAIVEELAAKGCDVIICYNKNKELAQELAKSLKGVKTLVLKLDVTSNLSITDVFDKIKKDFTYPNILINNAGVLVWKPFLEQSFEEIDNQVTTNFTGLMKVAREFLKKIPEEDQAIINISSIAANYVPEGLAPYSATKAAVITFTKGLAKELDTHTKVYSVSPGLTATDMTQNRGVPPKKVADIVIKVLTGEIEMNSGEDIDVRKYY